MNDRDALKVKTVPQIIIVYNQHFAEEMSKISPMKEKYLMIDVRF